MNDSKLFCKWRRWIDRIYCDQLVPLLVNREVFHQLQEALRRQKDRHRGAELAAWMVQCYVAFASTAIRRMVERPRSSWKSVSLVILLNDLKDNEGALTRQRFRRRYPLRLRERFADRDFDAITRKQGASRLTAYWIQRDIARLDRETQPVSRLVNKIIAHTELDRRRLGKATYEKLDRAVDTIEEMFRRYALLLKGAYTQTIETDVREDIKKILPE